MLDGSVRCDAAKSGRGHRRGSDAAAVADLIVGDAVLCQLVDERAGENEVEEAIDLVDQVSSWCLRPLGPPENSEDFHRGQQLPAAVGQFRSRCRSGCWRSEV